MLILSPGVPGVSTTRRVMTSAGHRNPEVLTPVIGIFGSLDLLLHFLKLSSVVIISLVILLAPLFGSATVVSTH